MIQLADAQTGPPLSNDRNKEIARNFYEDLWFSRKTDRYANYVADSFVVHDIGKRKNVIEPAVRQKEIADKLWDNGSLSGHIDFQIAEGDLVMTRWVSDYQAETLLGKLFFGSGSIPIINVMRFRDGKIVEFWNHRHDIDTNQTLPYALRGFAGGVAVAVIPLLIALRYRRRLKKTGVRVET